MTQVVHQHPGPEAHRRGHHGRGAERGERSIGGEGRMIGHRDGRVALILETPHPVDPRWVADPEGGAADAEPEWPRHSFSARVQRRAGVTVSTSEPSRGAGVNVAGIEMNPLITPTLGNRWVRAVSTS